MIHDSPCIVNMLQRQKSWEGLKANTCDSAGPQAPIVKRRPRLLTKLAEVEREEDRRVEERLKEQVGMAGRSLAV